MPFKPQAGAMATVLQKHGWSNREAIFVGNTTIDMKTASTGSIMFLNATWHGEATQYGFQFTSPLDVARFVDCICLGLDDWYWAVKHGGLQVYALAPFSTMSSRFLQAHAYSYSARSTAKDGAGDPTFWGRLLAARVYFSGLVDEIDYITAYPGHSPESPPTVIADALNILAGTLRKSYLPDLLVRHKRATKSQNARIAGEAVDVTNQLNTVHLNRKPLRNMTGNRYKSSPTRSGKTVLLVDDFCTQGNSFEAGRALINATGARTICLSWLKTISTDYRAVSPELTVANPYIPQTIGFSPKTVSYSYGSAVVSPAAEGSLDALYQRYRSWTWPVGT